jgi:hypothetical protein
MRRVEKASGRLSLFLWLLYYVMGFVLVLRVGKEKQERGKQEVGGMPREVVDVDSLRGP